LDIALNSNIINIINIIIIVIIIIITIVITIIIIIIIIIITVATLNIGPFVMLTEVGNNKSNYWAVLFNQNMRGNVD
jgi:hypothetical protein